MEKPWSRNRVAILALAFLFTFPTASFLQAQQKSKSTAVASDAGGGAQGSASADYVGADVYKTCHEDIYNGWEKSPHWKTTLDTKGGPSHQRSGLCRRSETNR